MANKKIRFLVEKKNKDGTVRRYWQPPKSLAQAGWPTVPLRHKETGQWMNELDAIVKCDELNRELDDWRHGSPHKASASAQNLDLLIDLYKKSPRFQNLAPKTQSEYRQHLKALSKWAGDQPPSAITKGLAQKYYEALFVETPAQANARMRVARLLYSYGERMDFVTTNPFAKAALMDLAEKGRIWSDVEVAHMVKTADEMGHSSMALLILLGHWLGHYPIDLINLNKAQWDEAAKTITLRRYKTKQPTVIELSEEITQRLKTETDRVGNQVVQSLGLIISNETGKRYSQSRFNKLFAEIRTKAAKTLKSCAELQFRHLRHTAVVRMAEAGCEVIEIAAVTAHSIKQCNDIIDRYLVRTEKLSRNAIKKRKAHARLADR